MSDPNPAPVIERMETFYATHAPFEADVAFERFVKTHDTSKREKGKLVFERPGRYQLTFANGDVVEADGGTLTIFDKAKGEAVRQSVSPDHVPAALAFAMTPRTIEKKLGLQRFDGIGLNAPGVDVILGTPQKANPSVSKLLFYVRPSGEVPRLVVIPPSGDRLQLDFTNVVPRATWPGSLQLPAGTTITNPPAPAPNAPPPVQSPFEAAIP